MTPRITGFSDLRGRFEPMPFDDAIAVRIEEKSLKELFPGAPVSTLNEESFEAWNQKREAWFMLMDMAQ